MEDMNMCGLVFLEGNAKLQKKGAESLSLLDHRGPDYREDIFLENAYLGFQRLSIMDISDSGIQPFNKNHFYLMCNGEVYNHLSLREECKDYDFHSYSDCEVILPLFLRYGVEETAKKLDSEFAFVIYDEKAERVYAARDAMGIRPLFYGVTGEMNLAFASEAKALIDIASDIKPFPPGHFYDGEKMQSFLDLTSAALSVEKDLIKITDGIRDRLVSAVEKRLHADVPMGFLLSGGLDSSLVCSIASRMSDKPIKTFAIGMEKDAIDLKFARIVADHIGSEHVEVMITEANLLEALEDVVYHLETWDITTVRASLGMYLISKYIQKYSDVKVLMTGEVSDELFGYKYTDYAPNPEAFQKEAKKRIRELYLYDVLRADRCIAAASLEARVPFSDKAFVSYVMSIDPKFKVNTTGHGKYLLRKSFEKGGYLPHEILYREKEAFSDAVGFSLVDSLKVYAERKFSSDEFSSKAQTYEHMPPLTKEGLLYREIFSKYYPNLDKLIPSLWMPNKDWENCDVDDPSARVLPNYLKTA